MAQLFHFRECLGFISCSHQCWRAEDLHQVILLNNTFLKKAAEVFFCLAAAESWCLTSEVPSFKRNLIPGLLIPNLISEGFVSAFEM